MSVEEKLRDNLKAAADALVVPQPKQAPASAVCHETVAGTRFRPCQRGCSARPGTSGSHSVVGRRLVVGA